MPGSCALPKLVAAKTLIVVCRTVQECPAVSSKHRFCVFDNIPTQKCIPTLVNNITVRALLRVAATSRPARMRSSASTAVVTLQCRIGTIIFYRLACHLVSF